MSADKPVTVDFHALVTARVEPEVAAKLRGHPSLLMLQGMESRNPLSRIILVADDADGTEVELTCVSYRGTEDVWDDAGPVEPTPWSVLESLTAQTSACSYRIEVLSPDGEVMGPMPANLHEHMEQDNVVRIGPGGTFIEDGANAPTVTSDGSELLVSDDRWQLVEGFALSGGPGATLHPDQFVDDRMVAHMRQHPGLYVATPIRGDDSDGRAWWVLAYCDDAALAATA